MPEEFNHSYQTISNAPPAVTCQPSSAMSARRAGARQGTGPNTKADRARLAREAATQASRLANMMARPEPAQSAGPTLVDKRTASDLPSPNEEITSTRQSDPPSLEAIQLAQQPSAQLASNATAWVNEQLVAVNQGGWAIKTTDIFIYWYVDIEGMPDLCECEGERPRKE